MIGLGTGDALVAKLATVAAAWNKAERAIKRAEVLRGELVVPAVNELRYAGRSLTDSLDAQSDEERSRLERDVILHCYQARRDAIIAQIIYLNEEITKISGRRLPSSSLRNEFDRFSILTNEARNLASHNNDLTNDDQKSWDRIDDVVDQAIASFQSIRFDVEAASNKWGVEIRFSRFALSILGESFRLLMALAVALLIATSSASLIGPYRSHFQSFIDALLSR